MKDLVTTRTNEDFLVLLNEVEKLDSKVNSGVYLRNLDRNCSRCYFLNVCLGKEKRFGRW